MRAVARFEERFCILPDEGGGGSSSTSEPGGEASAPPPDGCYDGPVVGGANALMALTDGHIGKSLVSKGLTPDA